MERMTKGEWMTPEEYIAMVEEENKKLKEDVDYRHHRCMVAERGWEDED